MTAVSDFVATEQEAPSMPKVTAKPTPANLTTRGIWVQISRSNPNLVPETIEVNRQRQEEVQWFSDDNENYKVVFQRGTPFDWKEFEIQSGLSTHSGKPNSNAIKDKHYKYSIEDRNGNTLVDPEIVIKG